MSASTIIMVSGGYPGGGAGKECRTAGAVAALGSASGQAGAARPGGATGVEARGPPSFAGVCPSRVPLSLLAAPFLCPGDAGAVHSCWPW